MTVAAFFCSSGRDVSCDCAAMLVTVFVVAPILMVILSPDYAAQAKIRHRNAVALNEKRPFTLPCDQFGR